MLLLVAALAAVAVVWLEVVKMSEITAGGKPMNNKLIVGMVVVFVVFSVFQFVQINSLKNSLGVNGASTGTTRASTSSTSGGGESYEAMMARMHPDQVAANKGSSGNSNAPSMVGGC